jgi:type VI secretion system secreted protein VgrG
MLKNGIECGRVLNDIYRVILFWSNFVSAGVLDCQTSLGSYVNCRLMHFSGQEGLSESFDFQLLLGADNDCELSALVGKAIFFSAGCGDDVRNFNGKIYRLEQLNSQGGYRCVYRLTLRPWFDFLSTHQDCRVFYDQSVIDICRFWFDYFSIKSFDFRLLEKDYPKISYCVQFNESVFDFLSRLLAEYGIFYYYRFDADGHTLVLGDGIGAYVNSVRHYNLDPYAGGYLHNLSIHHQPDPVHICWIGEQSNHLSKDIKTTIEATGPWAFAAVNKTFYSHNKVDSHLMAIKSHLQKEREQVNRQVVSFDFSGVQIATATRLTISGVEESVVVTQVAYDVSDAGAEVSKKQLKRSSVCSHIRAIPSGTRYVPDEISKPRFNGVHSAVISGDTLDQVRTDNQGRVRVRFKWDRHSCDNVSGSCWVPVIQGWAGAGYGLDFTPRVGHEVLVKYMDGDLDFPVVVGSVYNGSNVIPSMHLQQEKVSLIKTQFQPHSKVGENAFVLDHTPGKQRHLWEGGKDLLFSVKGDHLLETHSHVTSMAVGDITEDVLQGVYSTCVKQKIILQSGDSSVVIDPQGVDIQAHRVTFNND